MKIRINYENPEAMSVIEAVKATIEMYDEFLDTENIQNELNKAFDKVADGTIDYIADSPFIGIKVDGATKTIDIEIEPEFFCTNMSLSTKILKKVKPIVTMVKGIIEVASSVIESIKADVVRTNNELIGHTESTDKVYMVRTLNVEGHSVVAMARVTRWNTVEVVEAITMNVPEVFQHAALEAVHRSTDLKDWAACERMYLSDARKGFAALSGSESMYQVDEI